MSFGLPPELIFLIAGLLIAAIWIWDLYRHDIKDWLEAQRAKKERKQSDASRFAEYDELQRQALERQARFKERMEKRGEAA